MLIHRFGKERKVSVMEEAVRIYGGRRRVDPVAEERRQLLAGMADTRRLLNQAHAAFNSHSDPDLVESCVYEINSLQARYAYLARRLRELEHRVAAEGVV